MTSVAEVVDHAVGVDPHRDAHAAAVVDAGTTGVAAEVEITADEQGYRRVLAWAQEHAPGTRIWAIEGGPVKLCV